VVELGKAPINQTQLCAVSNLFSATDTTTDLSLLMVDHNVVRLDIAVHDALAVAEVQSLEELENVVPHVVVLELRV
jgi:hypothetical protein